MLDILRDHAFGRSEPFTVGAEEELILVEPPTYRIAHHSAKVLESMEIPLGSAHTDFFAALIEFTSPICSTAPETIAAVKQLRSAMKSAGATAIGAGVHPTAEFGDVVVSTGERYEWVDHSHAAAVHRTPEAAFHVHVGMPDPETAIRAFNGLRAHLPMLIALAANSPFWHGRDSGYASVRTMTNKAYPRFDTPRAFRDYEDYASTVSALVAAGELPDYTLVWWHVRLHPRLGTVEVRAMDSQSSLGAAAGLTALIHGLARHESKRSDAEVVPREIVAENCFRASRFGLEASVWTNGSLRPVRELAWRAIAAAHPHAVELGSEGPLEEIERILVEGNGAERQRYAAKRGGIKAVLDLLAEETALLE